MCEGCVSSMGNKSGQLFEFWMRDHVCIQAGLSTMHQDVMLVQMCGYLHTGNLVIFVLLVFLVLLVFPAVFWSTNMHCYSSVCGPPLVRSGPVRCGAELCGAVRCSSVCGPPLARHLGKVNYLQ